MSVETRQRGFVVQGYRRRASRVQQRRHVPLGIAEGKSPEAKLFGEHWRDWVRKWVQRICEAAGVPVVTAHGMRGLHSTLAVEHGVSAQVVAASLGHESSTTTMQSYVKPEAASGAQQKRVMTVLDGGRLAS